jgi:hypothetical protein
VSKDFLEQNDLLLGRVGHMLTMIDCLCLDRVVVGPCLTFKHIVQHNWTSLWLGVIFYKH